MKPKQWPAPRLGFRVADDQSIEAWQSSVTRSTSFAAVLDDLRRETPKAEKVASLLLKESPQVAPRSSSGHDYIQTFIEEALSAAPEEEWLAFVAVEAENVGDFHEQGGRVFMGLLFDEHKEPPVNERAEQYLRDLYGAENAARLVALRESFVQRLREIEARAQVEARDEHGWTPAEWEDLFRQNVHDVRSLFPPRARRVHQTSGRRDIGRFVFDWCAARGLDDVLMQRPLKNGRPGAGDPRSQYQHQLWLDLLAEGFNTGQVAEHFGVSEQAIRKARRASTEKVAPGPV